MVDSLSSNVDDLLELNEVSREFVMGEETVQALRGISMSVRKRERVAIVGRSGSGKSTLLNIIGLLDRPSSGNCLLAAENVSALNNRARARLRNQSIGFIFQQFFLLPNLTALENVELPMHYARLTVKQIQQYARDALDSVGLSARMSHRPSQMSGGERQRVAIARAIARSPLLLLADEPTGSLDSENGQRILELIENLNRERGLTVIMITHDISIANQFPRRIRMRDGTIESV